MSSTVTVRNDSVHWDVWLTSWSVFQPDIASFLLTWIEWNRNFESCNISGDWRHCRSSGDMPCECVIAMDDDAGRCPEDRKKCFSERGAQDLCDYVQPNSLITSKFVPASTLGQPINGQCSSCILFEVNCWPDCKPEGPLFSAEFVCLSVCLWLALLPFSVKWFWRNLVTRTLLWSSLAANIMVQIGRRGTARRLFKNF